MHDSTRGIMRKESAPLSFSLTSSHSFIINVINQKLWYRSIWNVTALTTQCSLHIKSCSQFDILWRLFHPLLPQDQHDPQPHVLLTNFSTFRPKQNGHHLQAKLKCMNLDYNFIEAVPKGPINNIRALVQIKVGAGHATCRYLNHWWLV